MTRDNKSKMTKEMNKRNKRSEELSRKTKNNNNSDNDSDWIESDSDMDSHEYRKFLSKLYPSKNLDKKIKAGEELKKKLQNNKNNNDKSETNEEDEIKNKKNNYKSSKNKNEKVSSSKRKQTKNNKESDEESEKEIKNKQNNKKSISKNKKYDSETETEISLGSKDTDESEDDYDDWESDYDEEDEDEDSSSDYIGESDDLKTKGSNKFNIIFTIGGVDEDEWETDESGYSESEEITENEDESVSSVSTSESENESESESESENKKSSKTRSNKSYKKESKTVKKTKSENDKIEKIKAELSGVENKVIETNENENNKLLDKLKELHNNDKNNKTLLKCIEVCEEELKVSKEKKAKKEKKQKEKNSRIFRKIIKDKNMMNDFTFFSKLQVEEQIKIIKELKEINKITRTEKPYRMTLLEAEMPPLFKAAAMKKINSLRYMEPGSGEFYKIKNWVDTFMRIPFGKYRSLDVSIDDGVEKCHEFMSNAQKTLDEAVYGLNDAKMQIMQLLGQFITNPKAIGTAIAIHGDPGTGKTSLVKEGISKILNRPFAFIALGGATDSSFLEGHSYTYEGSTWGKIVQILVDSKCMNPVIYFDELDKISDTPKGEEIAGILTHLTDTTQNSQFHDKYFAEIDFDLSKCLFIFSYNDESKVNPILRDRMYRIQTKGYNQKQKTIISNNYLLPKIREQVKFKNEDIIIPDDSIHYIIDNLCNKESGVRNLKRCLEIIYTKLNLYRLMKPDSNLFEEEMSLKVQFPFTVNRDIINKLIKSNVDKFTAWHTMYV